MQQGDGGKVAVISQADARRVSQQFRGVKAPGLITVVYLTLGSGEWSIDARRLGRDGDGFPPGRKSKRHVQVPQFVVVQSDILGVRRKAWIADLQVVRAHGQVRQLVQS